MGSNVVWAIPDHPWPDGSDDAAIRVAMTVLEFSSRAARVGSFEGNEGIVTVRSTEHLNLDLSTHADVSRATEVALRANSGLAAVGFGVYGAGLVLSAAEAPQVVRELDAAAVVFPYVSAKDILDRPSGSLLIDFGLRPIEEAKNWPTLLQRIVDRVKPERMANPDRWRRENWWLLGRPNRELRQALTGLDFAIGTPRTAKHRIFVALDRSSRPDEGVVCVALADTALLGVLSSAIHVTWALAAGGTLEDRPRYNKSLCFDPFPFPSAPEEVRSGIAKLAERIGGHRDAALARDVRITMTKIYNVIEKLRTGEPLTPAERTIHELAACGILRDLHDELDRLVAEAYGWPWPMEREEILERLVALHDERVEEEKRGLIRWLRPDYQIPRFAPEQAPATLALDEAPTARSKRGKKGKTDEAAVRAEPTKAPWPATAVEQIAAITSLVTQQPRSADEIAACFTGAQSALVARHLETLALMGEIERGSDLAFRPVKRVA